MRIAAAAVRKQNPSRLISAVPVAAPATIAELAKDVDEIVCVAAPEPFNAVSLWYQEFGPTSDEVVTELLKRSRARELVMN
jgi:putative phosphoribosyl transferase